MAPGTLYIKYPGLIVPIRFTVSIAILFISIKANVAAFYEQHDWRDYPAHILLLTSAVVNATFASLSIMLALMREDEKLPPDVRWSCAIWGILFRMMLFALTIVSVIAIAGYMRPEMSLWYVWIMAQAWLGLLLVVLTVGMGRCMKTMRDANAAGEEEVQKELIKMALDASVSSSCASTPIANTGTSGEHELENLRSVQPLFLGPPLDKTLMRPSSTASSTDSSTKQKMRPLSTQSYSSTDTLYQPQSQLDKQVNGKKYMTYDGPTWY